VTGLARAAEPFVGPPILRKPIACSVAVASHRRSKIWEFHPSLHCSIIGTCLTTGELRQVLSKVCRAPAEATDHDLHGIAVALAARHDPAAKLLNKALDQRHRVSIHQFSRAQCEAEVGALWRDAVGRGDIPGAYWAALTHPGSGHALIREAFGEVHMLSHLVGAANRADIRRLRELEQQTTDLAARLTRQQLALCRVVAERDGRIQALEQTLLDRIAANGAAAMRPCEAGSSALPNLVATLERRVASEVSRRTALEAQLARSRAGFEQESAGRRAAEATNRVLSAELSALEERLLDSSDRAHQPAGRERAQLPGETVLYVGGRAHQVAHLRHLVEGLDAGFLHHDGGREQHSDLLGGLVSRASLVLFPVDCVSHDAVLNLKRLCRQAGKAFIPLRSASVASLMLALHRVALERRTPGAAA
jgi:hypothetical protein